MVAENKSPAESAEVSLSPIEHLLKWQKMLDAGDFPQNVLQQMCEYLGAKDEIEMFVVGNIKEVQKNAEKIFVDLIGICRNEDLIFWGRALKKYNDLIPGQGQAIFKTYQNKIAQAFYKNVSILHTYPPTRYLREMEPEWTAAILETRNQSPDKILNTLEQKINDEVENKDFQIDSVSDFAFWFNFLRQQSKEDADQIFKEKIQTFEVLFEAFALHPTPQIADDLHQIINFISTKFIKLSTDDSQALISDERKKQLFASIEATKQNLKENPFKILGFEDFIAPIQQIFPRPRNTGVHILVLYQISLFSQYTRSLKSVLNFLTADFRLPQKEENPYDEFLQDLNRFATSKKPGILAEFKFQNFWVRLLSTLLSEPMRSSFTFDQIEQIINAFATYQKTNPKNQKEMQEQVLNIFLKEAQNMLRKNETGEFAIFFSALKTHWSEIVPKFCAQIRAELDNPNPQNRIQFLSDSADSARFSMTLYS